MHKDAMREHTSSSHNIKITVIFKVIKPPWKPSRFVFFSPLSMIYLPEWEEWLSKPEGLTSKSGSVKKKTHLVYDALRLSIFEVANREPLAGQSNLGNTATVN